MSDLAEKFGSMGVGFREGKGDFTEDQPILVMIHGAGGQAQIWQNQHRLSYNGIHTLALDMPGHGNTKAPAKSSIEASAQWLSERLDAVFDHPVYLMGHSMGGAIVQETACIHPAPLAGIILASTGPRLRVAPMFLEGLRNDFEQTVDTLIRFAYTEDTDPSIIKAGAQLMKAAGGPVVRDDFEACDCFEMNDKLADVRRSCLVICGEEDRMTPPSLSRKLHQEMKGSTLRIIPDAGHMVMIERPKAFNQCIADFILEQKKAEASA